MRIKSFAPEMHISPKDDLERKLVDNTDVISYAELQRYDQAIISHLKEIETANKNEKVSFIVDALSDKNIKDAFEEISKGQDITKLSHADIFILQKAVDRIKKALVDELKGKYEAC